MASLDGFRPTCSLECHLCRGRNMEGLEDELTCPVCLELYTCPLLLPCHHNLCRRCAEAFLETLPDEPAGAQTACSSEPAPPSPEGTPIGFPCPTCRKEVRLGDRGVDGLSRNLLLQNIVDRFKQIHAPSNLKRAVACLVCDATPPRDAVKSCTTCKLSYCDECLKLLHPPRGGLAKHKLVAPFDELQALVVCPEHKDKPVELYCMQDSTPVCSLCKLVSKHKDHDVTSLDEAFESRRVDLQKIVDEVSEKTELETKKIEVLEAKKAAMENHAAQLRLQIETECDELIDIIRQRKHAMLGRVDTVAQADTARMKTFIDSCQDAVKATKSSLALAKEALKESDPACFLQSEQAVRRQVEQSKDTLVQDEEYTRIPTDRLCLNMGPIKTLLRGLDLPSPPVICPDQCTTAMPVHEARVSWEAEDNAGVKFDVICSRVDNNTQAVSVRDVWTKSSELRGLQERTSYEVAILAKCDGGVARSNNFLFKTSDQPSNSGRGGRGGRGRGVVRKGTRMADMCKTRHPSCPRELYYDYPE
ncbi:probable E3 ubiquitin-protein ligase MID2 [Branchiostoma floridae]|uniref:Probable E3 ubiquitin-protein ligase MID2 n=1 Tax=Branchiostoma floridae TaxID=7739 RepID=A0A9J7LMD4_BRAFL|nr:probable E3 ubiquitin-protein ligase MID2 [Branchiostoma floridae]